MEISLVVNSELLQKAVANVNSNNEIMEEPLTYDNVMAGIVADIVYDEENLNLAAQCYCGLTIVPEVVEVSEDNVMLILLHVSVIPDFNVYSEDDLHYIDINTDQVLEIKNKNKQ